MEYLFKTIIGGISVENVTFYLDQKQEKNICIISTLIMTKFTRRIRTASSFSATKTKKALSKTNRALEMMLLLMIHIIYLPLLIELKCD